MLRLSHSSNKAPTGMQLFINNFRKQPEIRPMTEGRCRTLL